MAEERESVLKHPAVIARMNAIKAAVMDLAMVGVEVEVEMTGQGQTHVQFKDVGAGLLYNQDFTTPYDIEETMIESPDTVLLPDELRIEL